jgi:flagellar motor switch protein FliG
MSERAQAAEGRNGVDGPVRLKDVDAAQTRMVAIAKDLSARGEIVLSDGKSEDELIY